jgi:Holliday junction resolvase-like predicted endonuclease
MRASSAVQITTASAPCKVAQGRRAQRSGIDGEGRVAQALTASGWIIHGRRMRTAAGEIDIAAERDGLLALIEVKTRQNLDTAAGFVWQQRSCRGRTQAGDWPAPGLTLGWLMPWAACAMCPTRSATKGESPVIRGTALIRGGVYPDTLYLCCADVAHTGAHAIICAGAPQAE